MKKYIELFPGDVNYTGEDKLVQFQVHRPRMVLKGKHLLVVEMSFQRMFLYHLVSTFLPTLCLLIVSIITMYIDESHFEATIMVSLTSMLVMYTLFQRLLLHSRFEFNCSNVYPKSVSISFV